MKNLILYHSKYGHTKKIAFYIAEYLQNTGDQCKLIDFNTKTTINIIKYEKIIIGASVRYGNFNPIVINFIKSYYNELNQLKTAFFGVNLLARKANNNTVATNIYMKKFLNNIYWKPTITAVFAGALSYTKYNLFDRIMINIFIKLSKNKINKNQYIEFTNWELVKNFSKKIKCL